MSILFDGDVGNDDGTFACTIGEDIDITDDLDGGEANRCARWAWIIPDVDDKIELIVLLRCIGLLLLIDNIDEGGK